MRTAVRMLSLLSIVTLAGCFAPGEEPASTKSTTSGSSTTSSPGAASSGSTTGGAGTTTGSQVVTTTSTSTTGSVGSSDCAALLSDFCRLAQTCQRYDANCANVVAPNGLACDASSAPTCDGALRDAIAANDCTLFYGGGTPGAAACTTALAGAYYFDQSVPERGTCTQNSQCLPRPDGGSTACFAFTGCPGSCTAGDLGEKCYVEACLHGYCSTDDFTCKPYDGVGAPCTASSGNCDPVSTYCAWTQNATFSGTCQPYEQVGDVCSTVDGCEPTSTYCGWEPDGGAQCASRLATGGSCVSTGDFGCVNGDFCNFFEDGGAACTPKLQNGDPCVQGCGANNCASGICWNGVCVASQPTAPGIGDPCDWSSQFCAEGFCDSTDGGAGTCRALPALGQPCGLGYYCQAGLSCDPNGICSGGPGVGERCAGNASAPCRPGDYCDNSGICRAMGQLGDACDTTVQMPVCLDGRCDQTGHCAPLLAPGSPCDFQKSACSTQLSSCAVDSLPSGGFVWYCDDPACTVPPDGGSQTYCASTCN